MASDVTNTSQHVNDKGKGPVLTAETNLENIIDFPSPEICVICLDRISEKAIALPCNHHQFDFPCLGTWIQQSQVCPLCKAEVKAIKYHAREGDHGVQIFNLPAKEIPGRRSLADIQHRRARTQEYHPYSRGGSRRGRTEAQRGWGERAERPGKEDRALQVRKEVYRNKTYSAYVGTNRISQYRNVTPKSFATNSPLLNRAKTFIRRELQAFDFLTASSPSFILDSDRRASNAEFLLEYIVSMLKTIDLKGTAGQAEELLKDFLGRDNARLFLHELEAWLRSPYEQLRDWDRHVQYGDVVVVGESSRAVDGRTSENQ